MVQSTVPSGPPLLKEGLNLSLSKLSLVFDLNQWTRDLIWGVMDARCKFIIIKSQHGHSAICPIAQLTISCFADISLRKYSA